MDGRFRLGQRRLVCAVLLGAGVVSGSGTAGAQEEIAATFREAIAVELANVDVVVEDREGRPILGLAREDFTVLVDGRPAELTHFAAYRFDAAAADALARVAAPEPSRAPESIAATEVQAAVEAPPPATWVVYVDFSRLRHFARVQSTRATRRFLERAVRADERVLVLGFDTRALRVHGTLGDAAAAARALEKLEGRAVIPGRNVPLDADPFERAASEQERELALQLQLGALRDLLSIVDAIDGRVALLLVGGGIDLSGVAEDRRPVLATDYRRLLERANTGRVTMYSIYSGPERFPSVGADNAKEDEPDFEANLAYDVDPATPEGSSTLAAFARETGGLAFVGSGDLADRLGRVRDDLDAYYSLGYRPPAGSSAAVQRLEVKVRGEGLRVRHRTALRGRSQEQRAEGQTLAALLAPATSASPAGNPLGIAVEIGESESAKIGSALRVPVTLRVPISGLTLLEQGERHVGRLAFQFVVEAPDGGYRRLEPRELPVEIPAEQLAPARAQSLGYSFELKLLKGNYRLAVTVSDMVGSVHSTLTAPIEAGRKRPRR